MLSYWRQKAIWKFSIAFSDFWLTDEATISVETKSEQIELTRWNNQWEQLLLVLSLVVLLHGMFSPHFGFLSSSLRTKLERYFWFGKPFSFLLDLRHLRSQHSVPIWHSQSPNATANRDEIFKMKNEESIRMIFGLHSVKCLLTSNKINKRISSAKKLDEKQKIQQLQNKSINYLIKYKILAIRDLLAAFPFLFADFDDVRIFMHQFGQWWRFDFNSYDVRFRLRKFEEEEASLERFRSLLEWSSSRFR